MIWNVASARDQISLHKWSVQLHTSERVLVVKKRTLLAAMFLFHSCCFTHIL